MDDLALVTGAGRGIGRAVAIELAARGYHVLATGRDLAALRELQDEVGDGIEVGALDVAAPTAQAEAATLLRGRPLSLLVLNAARFSSWDESPQSADIAAARQVMETNLFGSWAVIQGVLPALRAAKGRIIGVGSGSGSHTDPQFGLAAQPGAASYAVSKAALHALLHKLAAAVEADGIDVYVVDPGLTATSPGMEEFGARPVREGALSVLAPLDADTPSTGLLRDGEQIGW